MNFFETKDFINKLCSQYFNKIILLLYRLIYHINIIILNEDKTQTMAVPLNKYQIFIVTFLCYTSIHSLRTSYSYAKSKIALQVQVQSKYMGIIDALMLCFLGLGHFLHALHPIKKPVFTLWIALILCGINYQLIPLTMLIKPLANIYMLAIYMSINGFLQSYTWPNLLMIINSRFNSQNDSALLGFWSSNCNFGNIMGYAVFEFLNLANNNHWQYGLSMCAIYATANGVYVGARLNQLPIAAAKQVRQQSFMQYDTKQNNLAYRKSQKDMITSVNSLQQNLLESKSNYGKSNDNKSIKSQALLSRPQSISGFSRRSIKQFRSISNKIQRGTIKSIRIVDQPEKVAETPLSITQVFKDPNVLLLTITFSLSKSVIYGIMLWLPQFFQIKGMAQYKGQIPIAYDIAAIFGSVGIGYLFKKIDNKGFLMIPFMSTLFICFFLLRSNFQSIAFYFVIISIVGFSLGGIFNTLSGLVVMQLTKLIPQNLKTSSLGFYSALTMAVGNITTAITQIIIGFVIGKQNPDGIFIIFMIYAGVSLGCLIMIATITFRQKGKLSKAEVLVIQQVKNEDQYDSGGQQAQEPKIILQPQEKAYSQKRSRKSKQST